MILLPVTVYLLRLYFIFNVCMYVCDTVFYCTFCTRYFSSFHVLLTPVLLMYLFVFDSD